MDGEDYGLRTLLDMHGYQFTLDNGYWWKIEAWGIEKSRFRPHGIRYNLTLHNAYNHRVFGMDNAHAIEPPKKADSLQGWWSMTISTAPQSIPDIPIIFTLPHSCWMIFLLR